MAAVQGHAAGTQAAAALSPAFGTLPAHGEEMMVDTDAPSPQPVPAANPGSARDTFSGGCGAVEAAETLIELPQRPAAHEGTNIKGSRDAFLFFTGGRSGRNSVTGGSDASELKAAKALSPAGAVPMPSAAEAPGGHVSTPHPMLTPPIPAYATHTVPEEAEDGEQSLKRRRLVDALVDELDDGNREGLEVQPSVTDESLQQQQHAMGVVTARMEDTMPTGAASAFPAHHQEPQEARPTGARHVEGLVLPRAPLPFRNDAPDGQALAASARASQQAAGSYAHAGTPPQAPAEIQAAEPSARGSPLQTAPCRLNVGHPPAAAAIAASGKPGQCTIPVAAVLPQTLPQGTGTQVGGGGWSDVSPEEQLRHLLQQVGPEKAQQILSASLQAGPTGIAGPLSAPTQQPSYPQTRPAMEPHSNADTAIASSFAAPGNAPHAHAGHTPYRQHQPALGPQRLDSFGLLAAPNAIQQDASQMQPGLLRMQTSPHNMQQAPGQPCHPAGPECQASGRQGHPMAWGPDVECQDAMQRPRVGVTAAGAEYVTPPSAGAQHGGHRCCPSVSMQPGQPLPLGIPQRDAASSFKNFSLPAGPASGRNTPLRASQVSPAPCAPLLSPSLTRSQTIQSP